MKVLGNLKKIADICEPLKLSKKVEEDVMERGLELHAAIRQAREELKRANRRKNLFGERI